MKKRELGSDYPPRRRDAAIASPYTKKDDLTEIEKKERIDKFRSSSLKDKYFKL
ncbi:hypothetical protein [Pragia fontium]|uniref:hypothetical protein n=1 Tax=Pragia fontium TaxID=82985 RepID=UPI000F6E8D0B|nr:hypothetical protein [Pragia fontium]VEJ54661.1 Uncharacterised protein [Pragia fontium]